MKEYISSKKLKFILSTFLVLLVSVGTLYSIYIRSEAVNLLLAGDTKVYNVIFFMLGVIAVTELLKVVLTINNASLLKSWNLMLGKKISTNIVNMGFANFHKYNLGNYISWYTGDLPLVNSYMFNNTLVIINYVTLSITALVMLYIINWKLVAFSVVLLLLLLFFGSRFGKIIGAAYQNYGIKNGKFNNTLQEYLGGYDLLKNFKRLELMAEKIEEGQEELEDQMYRIKKYSAFGTLGFEGVKRLFEGAMFIFTVYLVANNELSLGMLVVTPFILEIFLTSAFNISNVIVQYNGGKPLKEKLEQVEFQEAITYPSLKEDIRFDEVTFKYGEKTILENVDFEFNKNKKYAIIGESGSGKSTLLKMILGRLTPTKGIVQVDDTSLDTTKDIDFSKEIAYVSQENYLFDLSVRDNITLGEDISDEKIYQVLKEVKVDHVVHALEKGLDTPVGSLGGQLSGGERQRICLARALVRDLPIIILDEATSAIDKATTQEIENIILSKENKTVIMISHHLEDASKEKLDKIYEIRKIS